jgi:hypothetical protein
MVTLLYIMKQNGTEWLWQVIRKAVKKIKIFVRSGTSFGYFINQFNEDKAENSVGEPEEMWLSYLEKLDGLFFTIGKQLNLTE